MNRSIIKDQQKLDIQTESAEVLIPLLVYPIMTTLIILFSYLFGILAFKHSIKSAKESKKHSDYSSIEKFNRKNQTETLANIFNSIIV